MHIEADKDTIQLIHARGAHALKRSVVLTVVALASIGALVYLQGVEIAAIYAFGIVYGYVTAGYVFTYRSVINVLTRIEVQKAMADAEAAIRRKKRKGDDA